jgi:hypothetical protein
MMEPHFGIGVGIASVSIFETSVHSDNHAFGARFVDGRTGRIPDHSLAASTNKNKFT